MQSFYFCINDYFSGRIMGIGARYITSSRFAALPSARTNAFL